MEIFGGFMMMMSIIGFFLVVIWFILPFVIFNIKGRVDRAVAMLEEMDRRLKTIEVALERREERAAPETAARHPEGATETRPEA